MVQHTGSRVNTPVTNEKKVNRGEADASYIVSHMSSHCYY
jgi:hypothetical protein